MTVRLHCVGSQTVTVRNIRLVSVHLPDAFDGFDQQPWLARWTDRLESAFPGQRAHIFAEAALAIHMGPAHSFPITDLQCRHYDGGLLGSWVWQVSFEDDGTWIMKANRPLWKTWADPGVKVTWRRWRALDVAVA